MKLLMKIGLFLLVFTTLKLNAQWSNDPANPLLLSTAPDNQSKPVIISDNNEGNFVFWLDKRSGITNVYGQHVDKMGNQLWESNGRLIVESPIDIWDLNAVTNNEGNILLAWYRQGDTLFIQKYDSDATPLWAAPTNVAGDDATFTNTFWGPVGPIAMLVNGDGCFLAYNLTGWGYDNLLYNKVEGDGSLPWGYNGIQHVDMSPAGIGKIKLFSDGAGGAFLQSFRGLFYFSRFDSNGNVLWGEIAMNDCTSGTGGTYASHTYYEMQPDDDNGWIAAWTSASDDVFATRIDEDGAFVWTPECQPILENPNQQEDIAFTKSGDGYYATWRDSRIDAPGIYMQKINDEGITQWDEPIYVEDTSLYIPVMKSIATSEGDIVVFYQTSWYFAAQKVYADGTTAWPQPLKILEGTYQPFYEDYQLFATADNNVIGVAQYTSGLESNIVMFNLNWISGDTITVDPVAITSIEKNNIQVYPNPVNDILNIQSEQPVFEIVILDMHGAVVYRENTSGIFQKQLDLQALPKGVYVVKLTSASGTEIQELVKS
jgi:hypothetical protein